MIEWLLRVAAIGLVTLAVLHAGFPRWFGWRAQLAGLTLLNRQLVHVHTLFIGAMLVLFGALTYVAAGALDERSPLLRALFLGFAAFWLLRLLVQLFVFDPRLWRGHGGRTLLHALATLIWAGLTGLYAWAYWMVR